MRKITLAIILLSFFAACKTPSGAVTNKSGAVSAFLLGNFTDDYNIHYSINDSLWIQHPNIKYHIIQSNVSKQYLIARNDSDNPSDAGLYTRIDYMEFQNMESYKWGFCLTVYNAKTEKDALVTSGADRQNPRSGCGGFPFSRMKKERQ